MDSALWSSHEKMLAQPLKDSDAEVRLWHFHRLLHWRSCLDDCGFFVVLWEFCFVSFHFFCAVRGGTHAC